MKSLSKRYIDEIFGVTLFDLAKEAHRFERNAAESEDEEEKEIILKAAVLRREAIRFFNELWRLEYGAKVEKDTEEPDGSKK